MHRLATLAVATALAAIVSGGVHASITTAEEAAATATTSCRLWSGDCGTCLRYPMCGYCNTTGACVEGNVTGPSFGSCPSWDFDSCNGVRPPVGDDYWTVHGGGNAQRQNFKSFSLVPKPVARQRWSAMLSGAVIFEGLVCGLASSGNGGVEVHCVNEVTGDLSSSISLGPQSSCGGMSYLVNRLLVVSCVGANEGIQLYAFERQSGSWRKAWTNSKSSQWSTYPYGPIAIGNTIVFIGGEYSGVMYAVDAATGSDLWSATSNPSACDQWGATEHEGSFVWAGCAGNGAAGSMAPSSVGAVSAASGTRQWREEWPSVQWNGYSTFWYAVSALPDVVLASPVNGSNGVFTALTVSATGNVSRRWTVECPLPSTTDLSMATEMVNAFFVCEDHLIIAGLEHGTVLANITCPGCLGTPLIVDTHVFVNDANCVYGYYRYTLERVVTYCKPAEDASLSRMMFHGGWMFIENVNGRVFAVQFN